MSTDSADAIRKLRELDWRFSDYSSAFEPISINNIHWYPAPFVPHIPSILIKSLSRPGEIVLDPFCGTGITGIEAARLNRRFVQFDINPLAVDVTRAKLLAVALLGENVAANLLEKITRASVESTPPRCNRSELDELKRWFHPRTLSQLLLLRDTIDSWEDNPTRLVLKVIFSSILHGASSQPKHYSYIVDNCHPRTLEERDAFSLFLEKSDRVVDEAKIVRRRCYANGVIIDLAMLGITDVADARNLKMLPDHSVDLVVTSPPYVNVNDYVKSQRLTYLFYPPFPSEADEADIGARRKRHRSTAIQQYLSDMEASFKEMARVTKQGGFVCVALGQSSSASSANVVDELTARATDILGNRPAVDVCRPIVFRKIQNPGVGSERLIIFQKK